MLSNALISSLMFTVLLRKASAVDIFPEVPSIPSSRETTSDPAVLYEGNEEGPLHDRRHLAAARPPDRYVVVNGIKHRLKSLGEDLELDTPTSSPVSDGSEGDMQAVGGQHPKRDLAPSEVGGRQVINGNPYDLLPSGNCTDPRAATVRFADGSEIDLCPIDPPAHSKRWFRHPHVHDRQTYHGTEFELVPLHTCPARPHAEIEFEEGSIFDL